MGGYAETSGELILKLLAQKTPEQAAIDEQNRKSEFMAAAARYAAKCWDDGVCSHGKLMLPAADLCPFY